MRVNLIATFPMLRLGRHVSSICIALFWSAIHPSAIGQDASTKVFSDAPTRVVMKSYTQDSIRTYEYENGLEIETVTATWPNYSSDRSSWHYSLPQFDKFGTVSCELTEEINGSITSSCTGPMTGWEFLDYDNFEMKPLQPEYCYLDISSFYVFPQWPGIFNYVSLMRSARTEMELIVANDSSAAEKIVLLAVEATARSVIAEAKNFDLNPYQVFESTINPTAISIDGTYCDVDPSNPSRGVLVRSVKPGDTIPVTPRVDGFDYYTFNVTALGDVVFVPDPLTHSSATEVTVLPADVEKVTAQGSSAWPSGTIYFGIADTAIARINNSRADDISQWPVEPFVSTGNEDIFVAGLSPGTTELLAHYQSPTGPIIARIPVTVGGSISFVYDVPPTYGQTSGDSIGSASAPSPGVNLGSARDLGYSSFRVGIPTEIAASVAQIPLQEAYVTISIFDGNGVPKKGKYVGLLSTSSKLQAVSVAPGATPITDVNGQYNVRIRCANDKSYRAGVDKDTLVVLAGRSADGVLAGVPPANLATTASSKLCRSHVNDLQRLRYGHALVTSTGMETAIAVEMPMINHAQYQVVMRCLIGDGFEEPSVIGGSIKFDRYDNGQSTVVTADVPATSAPFSDPTLRNAVITSVAQVAESSPDSGTLQPSASPSAATIAAELAISMVPGGDFVDVCKEFIWKPMINNEEPNNVTGLISFVSLSMSAGYLAGPAGVVTKATATIMKTVLKMVPAPIVKWLFRAGTSFIAKLANLFSYIFKIPGNPVAKVQHVLERVNRLLHTKIAGGFTTQVTADAFDVISRSARSALSHEASEGVAVLVKSGRGDVAEAILKDTALTAAESEKAMRGVQVAQKATDAAGLPVTMISEIVNGTAPMTTTRIRLSFGNLEALEGTDGIENFVKFLKNNADNASGIDGCIYESTVARRLKNGEVVGSGQLTRYANDGVSGQNKIDVISDHWAAQIKHKTTVPPNYGISQLGDISEATTYLDELRSQAAALNKTPVFITNCPITAGLQDLLAEPGKAVILWVQVAP